MFETPGPRRLLPRLLPCRLTALTVALTLAVTVALTLGLTPLSATAQSKKDSVVIGLTLEPTTGLDPTAGAAAAIGEITHYNVFEGLLKVNQNGSLTPLLADSWTISPDQKTFTFKLKSGVKFQNGEPFNAAAVKYSFERAVASDSTNKDKAVFNNFASVEAKDAETVVITLKELDPDVLFELGQNTAIIVEPKSAATNNTKPVGTGPYKLDNWVKGSSITLSKWGGYRAAPNVKLNKITVRFVSDSSAQVAALLSGDIDLFPRAQVARSLDQFTNDKRFQVMIGVGRGKGIVAINNKKKPLDNVLVRRAIAAAIDRKAFIDGALEGLGTPIGSHYVPSAFGYVDTTGINPYNPEKARALLKESGVPLPLELSLKLPPPAYARLGGEIIAAQLAKVGINAKIENVEWAQWLSGVYRNKNYDLSIILHAEPLDIFHYAEPAYYWQYDSERFRVLYNKARSAESPTDRARWMGDVQKLLAEDAVNTWLWAPQFITIANSKLKGAWKDVPIFANDFSALHWE